MFASCFPIPTFAFPRSRRCYKIPLIPCTQLKQHCGLKYHCRITAVVEWSTIIKLVMLPNRESFPPKWLVFSPAVSVTVFPPNLRGDQNECFWLFPCDRISPGRIKLPELHLSLFISPFIFFCYSFFFYALSLRTLSIIITAGFTPMDIARSERIFTRSVFKNDFYIFFSTSISSVLVAAFFLTKKKRVWKN